MTEQDVGDQAPRMTQSLPVPNNTAGWLIGRGGDHARFVTNSSGCRVHVDQDERAVHRHVGHEWCYVRLHGTTHEIDQAKKLIVLRLMDWRPDSI